MNTFVSKYIEKRGYLSRYSHERLVELREERGQPLREFGTEEAWARAMKQELPRFIPFLITHCDLDFHGRILEIGAGGGWLSAEISKLPKVVEIVTTDFSARQLQEHAPRVFKLLNANGAKITRIPGDFHQLDFPANHFDFVVSSGVLQHATNIIQVLREMKRVLKPGGRFVAIREPVWPLMTRKSSRRKMPTPGPGGLDLRHYSLSQYREFFKQAGLPLKIKRVNLSRGFKYLFGQMVNGLTHARYAFIGTKIGTKQTTRVTRPTITARKRT